MKIINKLFLGFGLYVVLAMILGVFAYEELLTITKRLTLVEVADDITNTILEIRRYEKNFLLFKDKKNLQELKDHLNTLKRNIDNIRAEIINEMGAANYEMIKKAIIEYESLVDKIAENFRLQEKITTTVTSAGRELERKIKKEELELFLILKKHEKDLMLSKDKATYEALMEAVSFISYNRPNDAQRYKLAIDELFNLYEDEDKIVDKMRREARGIQALTQDLSKKERLNIIAIIERARNLLLFALLMILILGIAINIKLSRSIATPIRKLEEITKKLAAGDFSEHIEVKGRDEIASLEASFNQMETRLQDVMLSLEHAIKRLHEKQEELVEAEKLASLGRIAAGVAHEINNPIAIINEKAGLIQDILKTPEDFLYREKFLNLTDGIINSVNRCRSITHRLLGFARRMDVAIEPMSLIEVFKEVKGFLEKEIALKNIKIKLDFSDNLPEIRSDKGQIEQVLLNIIKNAIDAVEDGGLIEVSTRVKEEDRVCISVKDNGPGIPRDRLKRIFEPFFTTKERGKGIGLGLFVSYGIMKGLGGNILVESEVGKGSTFTLDLPIKAEILKEEIHETS